MFGSTVLEVAIGLIFTFLMVSLVTSAVTEALASAFGWRANTLLQGVKSLLNDDQFNGLALSLYNNALVHPRGDGKARALADFKSLPSYVDSTQFAAAFTQVVGLTPSAAAKLVGNIDPAKLATALNGDVKINDPQLQKLVAGFIGRAAGDLGKVQAEIGKWFDSGMDRISGVYKRKTQAWSLAIAFALAAFLNIDAIAIAAALWKQPMVVDALGSAVPNSLQDFTPNQVLDKFHDLNLPYGWTGEKLDAFWTSLLSRPWSQLPLVFGWLIAAISTLLGAPFWFDALQKIAQIRGADGANSTKST